MDEPVQRIHNRRRRRALERFQFAFNATASVLLAGPMVLEGIKPVLPEHYFGAGSAVLAVVNAGIGVWRLHVRHGDVRVD